MARERKKTREMSTVALATVLIIYSIVTAMRYYVQILAGFNEKLDHGVIYLVASLFWLYFIYELLSAHSYSVFELWYRYKSSAIPVLLFFGISFVVGGIAHGFNYRWFFLVVQLGLYGVPTVFAASEIAKKSNEMDVFKQIEKMSFIHLPMVLVYVVMAITNSNPTKGANLGSLNYMQLSYSIMPFMFSTIILAIQKAKEGSGNKNIFIVALRGVLTSLYTLALLVASTRNTILSIVTFLVFLLLYFCFRRKEICIKGLLLTLVIVIGSSSIVLHNIDSLPGFRRVGRMIDYTDIVVERVLGAKDNTPAVKKRVIVDEELEAIESGKKKIDEKIKQKGVLSSRSYLFGMAVFEAKNNPFYGLLPLGFYSKYHPFYPHNVFLELLAEWGVFIGGAASLFVVYLFMKLIGKNHSQMMMLGFLTGYIPQLMSSGSVWNSYILFFGVSYAMAKLFITMVCQIKCNTSC